MGILGWIVFGLVVGLLARAVMPGKQQMGLIMTTLLGMAGSVVGGFFTSLFTGHRATDTYGAGFIGSLLGALLLLWLVGSVFKRRGMVTRT